MQPIPEFIIIRLRTAGDKLAIVWGSLVRMHGNPSSNALVSFTSLHCPAAGCTIEPKQKKIAS